MKIEKLVLELQKIAAEHPESEVKFKGNVSVEGGYLVFGITEVKYSEKHDAVMLIR